MLKIFVYLVRKILEDPTFGQISYGQIKSVPWGVEQFFLASDPDVQTGLTQMRQIKKIYEFLSDENFFPEAKQILLVLNGEMEELMFKQFGAIQNRNIKILHRKEIAILDL